MFINIPGSTIKQNLFSVVLENGYKNALKKFMKVRWMAFVIIARMRCRYLFGGQHTCNQNWRRWKTGASFVFQLSAPEGTSFDYMDNYVYKSCQLYDGLCSGKKTGAISNLSKFWRHWCR